MSADETPTPGEKLPVLDGFTVERAEDGYKADLQLWRVHPPRPRPPRTVPGPR